MTAHENKPVKLYNKEIEKLGYEPENKEEINDHILYQQQNNNSNQNKNNSPPINNNSIIIIIIIE
jgi:hypothetical protein